MIEEYGAEEISSYDLKRMLDDQGRRRGEGWREEGRRPNGISEALVVRNNEIVLLSTCKSTVQVELQRYGARAGMKEGGGCCRVSTRRGMTPVTWPIINGSPYSVR